MYGTYSELDTIIAKLTQDNQRTIAELSRKLLTLQNLENPDAKTLEQINLVEYIGIWIQQLRSEGKSPETIRTYSHYVTVLLAEFPRPTSIHIDTYLATKSTPDGPLPSNHARINSYKSFFRFLTRRGILLNDPTEHLERPKFPHRTRKVPAPDTVLALLNLPDTPTRATAILLLLVGCGIRATELLTLKPSSVDLVRSEITVAGKGNKERVVPMPEETAEAVLLQLSSLPEDSVWLFPGQNPAKHLDLSTLEDALARLCKEAEVEPLTAHYFRHYYASVLLNSGVDLLTVSELLGHSSPDVTARIYWHDMVAGKHHRVIQAHNPLKGLTSASEDVV